MKRTAQKTGLALIAAGLLGGAGIYLSKLARYNPFLPFESSSSPTSGFPITMTDAVMHSWNQGKLVSSARFAQLAVRQDFAEIRANGVSDGVFRYKDQNLKYSAAAGDYNITLGSLAASGVCQLKGKDFNLESQGFFYKENNHLLNIPLPVTGTLAKGQLIAKNASYNLQTEELITGPIQWQGMFSLQQAAGQKSTSGGSDETKPHPWTFKAEGSKSATVKGVKTRIFFTAEASDGKIIVRSPEIDQDVKTDVLTCKGPVFYYSPKVDLTCDSAVIHRTTKEAILTGHVVMYVKPKDAEVLSDKDQIPPFKPMTPDQVDKQNPPKPMVMDPQGKQLDQQLRSNDSIRKFPAVVFADKIDYFYADGTKHGTLTGNPQAQQELPGGRWRMVWALQAYYDGEADTIRLTGRPKVQDVKIKDSLGDDFNTTEFTASTEEGNDSYEAGPSSGVYYTEDDQLNKSADEAGKTDKNSPTGKDQKGKGKDGSSKDGSSKDSSGKDGQSSGSGGSSKQSGGGNP